jgi:hypothetical protein
MHTAGSASMLVGVPGTAKVRGGGAQKYPLTSFFIAR